ncbi:uncharacterized protein BJX67DRAFT_384144 [Aspergillus lucknowensis]|uniref:Uncharacterized protein n=1 Tax=Aspergillus lucknowensis TaxID=176173 RepID=A0ABR4LHD6_9EURO
MANRPNPHAPGTTHMDVIGISLAVQDLITGKKDKEPDGDVNGVWNSILNWLFDLVEGYVTNPQDQHKLFAGCEGFSDCHTKQRFVDGHHTCFLITQCKRIGKQNADGTWNGGYGRLRGYLHMEHGVDPVEIALMIINQIQYGSSLSQERIRDTRSALEAFQWTLRDSYWIKRCEPELVYEVGDLVASGKSVDSAEFCLGPEELMVEPHWFCNSGLECRKRILRLLRGIKARFDEIVEREGLIPDQIDG